MKTNFVILWGFFFTLYIWWHWCCFACAKFCCDSVVSICRVLHEGLSARQIQPNLSFGQAGLTTWLSNFKYQYTRNFLYQPRKWLFGQPARKLSVDPWYEQSLMKSVYYRQPCNNNDCHFNETTHTMLADDVPLTTTKTYCLLPVAPFTNMV